MVNVLVVGSGAREHALCWSLAGSARLGELFCAPGNVGTAGLAVNLPIPVERLDDLSRAATERGVDLVIVGPEVPLAGGLVDRLTARGIAAFGPTAAAARVEASKAWAKDLLRRAGVPTARAEVATTPAEGRRVLNGFSYPVVLKADGLASGKGVVTVPDSERADEYFEDVFTRRSLGSAGDRVLIEEHLAGRELSVLAFCDGERLALMPAARDYKALKDGDQGPNTGGMGCYSRPRFADPDLIEHVRSRILEPVVRAMAAEGCPFTGVLYAGVMVTEDGPKVLEFNCRFGDPETQVILPLLASDLLDVLQTVAEGRLEPDRLRWHPGSTCGVVLASAGYPGPYPTGRPIHGLTEAAAEALVFHAGTARGDDGAVVTAGGRVLTVVGRAEDLPEARARAYAATSALRYDGRYLRTDIAADDGGEAVPVARVSESGDNAVRTTGSADDVGRPVSAPAPKRTQAIEEC